MVIGSATMNMVKTSAPAITAELEKDKTYYFVVGPYSTATGEFSITITCAHEKTHIEGRTFSNCTVGWLYRGY